MEQALSSYKVFYEVAKAGNISKAGKTLQISQPAISKSIVKLEEQIGVKLFHRNSRGVHLTAEGEVLFEHVREAFDSIEQGETELRRIREFHIGHLKIGSSTTLCKYLLVPYLKEYLKENPHMKITIENQATAKTIQKIENHRLDVGGGGAVPVQAWYEIHSYHGRRGHLCLHAGLPAASAGAGRGGRGSL